MSLGKTIAQLRTRKGWTQAQLAEHVGMTSAHINRLEHDRMKPRPKTLERLAEAFGTSIADLTQAVEHPLAAEQIHYAVLADDQLPDVVLFTHGHHPTAFRGVVERLACFYQLAHDAPGSVRIILGQVFTDLVEILQGAAEELYFPSHRDRRCRASSGV